MKSGEPTPISGITYYTLPGEGMVTGLDGRVRMQLGDIPVPLLDDDYHAL